MGLIGCPKASVRLSTILCCVKFQKRQISLTVRQKPEVMQSLQGVKHSVFSPTYFWLVTSCRLFQTSVTKYFAVHELYDELEYKIQSKQWMGIDWRGACVRRYIISERALSEEAYTNVEMSVDHHRDVGLKSEKRKYDMSPVFCFPDFCIPYCLTL